jgi:hypothetical protein
MHFCPPNTDFFAGFKKQKCPIYVANKLMSTEDQRKRSRTFVSPPIAISMTCDRDVSTTGRREPWSVPCGKSRRKNFPGHRGPLLCSIACIWPAELTFFADHRRRGTRCSRVFVTHSRTRWPRFKRRNGSQGRPKDTERGPSALQLVDLSLASTGLSHLLAYNATRVAPPRLAPPPTALGEWPCISLPAPPGRFPNFQAQP